jgi:alkylated DNA nucleotide flippase Atl1
MTRKAPDIPNGSGATDRPDADHVTPGASHSELDGFASRVLDVVDAIPAGRVMSYGDIAGYLGEGGPRQVGRVMALWGGGVAWWRVIHADGTPASGHERAALARYREENTPLRSEESPVRVDMRRARWTG